ncbi:T9SS type A sorting domain-containing protein [Yeosuana sp. MJ-SS3]|uniref:T9SS type A sorting domain-containing protein n=1 Tax=Gilvirhabdus luticola TaxID=3079858 RepID=A0ABU3U2R1_9FLAO|nr:T9SS type A sorting domain-containing protein [Yeosuana sp. MJ-SS3]MDU8884673.1 T9SS type A sorting domain-containing protein [Yeosuana sp. MJ-SS3]
MKIYGLILLFLSLASLNLRGQNSFQGFEGSIDDNWNYNTNIPFYNLNGNDVWGAISGSNGRIDGAYKGISYMAGRDLDNPYSESVSGTSSPEHILTFQTIAVNGAPSELSFRINYVFLDKNDYIYFQVKYDNGSDWSSPDVHTDVFNTSQNGNFATNDWVEFNHTIPSGKSHVRFRLVFYQNGNGYIGLDNVQLLSFPLSIENNKIDGFAYGPNPINNILNLRARVALDKVSVFDISGKEIFSKRGDTKEMTLDVSNLATGVYLAKIESQGLSQTVKVIKR